MIAGLILTNTEKEESNLAFISDDTETYSIKNTEKLVEKLKEEKPDVLAVNVSSQQSREEFTNVEEDLKEEGYNFTPSSSQPKKIKRLQAIKAVLERDMANSPDFIRFDPYITSEELALDSDKALSSIGVNPNNIGSSKEFDAVLGAVTARFYQQNQYKDLGVIVPQSLDE